MKATVQIRSFWYLLNDLESSDNRFQPFVAEVRQLADNYKFKQIRQYIKSFQVEKN